MTHVSQSIVLRLRPYREYDVLVTLFTYDYGKLEAVVRGARRPLSKLRGGLEMMSCSQIMVASGRNFYHLAGCQQLVSYQSIKKNYLAYVSALLPLETVDKMTEPAVGDQTVFLILKNWLDFLENYNLRIRPALLPLMSWLTVVKLFQHFGYGPQVFNCLRCGQEISEQDDLFSYTEGGVICRSCANSDDVPINRDVIKILRFFLRPDDLQAALWQWSRLSVSDGIRTELLSILQKFSEYILDRQLNTGRVINQLS